ncbi:SPW repeat domain-containing protein [Natronobacterium texcoconense]|uniref:SPW repeat-containing protein n=1 Tax=Natronobacterium texcoconense TaxID=1095778 RepID=A0A1H1GD97_NATTX|nr:SPW repeat protein [Natronobacterium texcoconense]SDR11151.1 SPW repeat-containing protein [Natronobacterium texcoconense]
MTTSDRGSVRTASSSAQRTIGLSAGIGAWLLVSGVFFTGTGWIVIHNVLVGGAIAVTASYAAAFPNGSPIPVPSVAARVVAVLLGLWTIASAFVFDPVGILFWNNLLVGAAVTVLGAASVYTSQQTADVSSTTT